MYSWHRATASSMPTRSIGQLSTVMRPFCARRSVVLEREIDTAWTHGTPAATPATCAAPDSGGFNDRPWKRVTRVHVGPRRCGAGVRRLDTCDMNRRSLRAAVLSLLAL